MSEYRLIGSLSMRNEQTNSEKDMSILSVYKNLKIFSKIGQQAV